MILTVCPNPCIDCTIEVEDLKIGRLNRVEHKQENMSGKALNSAVGVSRLDGKVLATGFMFETGGKRFSKALNSEGIDNQFVWTKGSVRVNYKIIDGKSMMTEINDRGEKVPLTKQKELLTLVEDLSKDAEMVIISGSLPRGVESTYYYELCKAVNKKSKIVVDCEKENLYQALKAGVFMVKPNLAELEKFAEKKFKSYDEMIDSCKDIIKLGAKYVLLSLGAGGAILTDGIESYFCKSANVAVNSTVGAGDSMVASACVAFLEKQSLDKVLMRAVAAGTASVTTSGTNLFTKDKYLEILDKLSVRKL